MELLKILRDEKCGGGCNFLTHFWEEGVVILWGEDIDLLDLECLILDF